MPEPNQPLRDNWWKRNATRVKAWVTKEKRNSDGAGPQQSALLQNRRIPNLPIVQGDPERTNCISVLNEEDGPPTTDVRTANKMHNDQRAESRHQQQKGALDLAATPDDERTITSASSINQISLYAALAQATHEGDEELVRTLLRDSGARVLPESSEPVKNCGSFRCTIQPSPLHEAIYMGQSSIANLLLDEFSLNGGLEGRPANESDKKQLAEIKDVKGRTLLAAACVAGDTNIVKRLLDMGAQTEIRDRNALTSLHLAARSSTPSPSIVKLLIDNGADMNAKDDRWITVVQDAENNLLPEEVAILLRPSVQTPRPRQRRKRARVPHPATTNLERVVGS